MQDLQKHYEQIETHARFGQWPLDSKIQNKTSKLPSFTVASLDENIVGSKFSLLERLPRSPMVQRLQAFKQNKLLAFQQLKVGSRKFMQKEPQVGRRNLRIPHLKSAQQNPSFSTKETQHGFLAIEKKKSTRRSLEQAETSSSEEDSRLVASLDPEIGQNIEEARSGVLSQDTFLGSVSTGSENSEHDKVLDSWEKRAILILIGAWFFGCSVMLTIVAIRTRNWQLLAVAWIYVDFPILIVYCLIKSYCPFGPLAHNGGAGNDNQAQNVQGNAGESFRLLLLWNFSLQSLPFTNL